jgi:hypothetical protein
MPRTRLEGTLIMKTFLSVICLLAALLWPVIPQSDVFGGAELTCGGTTTLDCSASNGGTCKDKSKWTEADEDDPKDYAKDEGAEDRVKCDKGQSWCSGTGYGFTYDDGCVQ